MNDRGLAIIVELLRIHDNVLILSHLNPDGDSVGSVLALGRALEKQGKKVTLTTIDPVPLKYRFLPGADAVKTWQEAGEGDYQLFVALDSSDLARLEPLDKELLVKERLVNIDHHVSNHNYGRYNYVDVRAGSTGEIILQILDALGQEIDREMALCLYVALCTDTGCFRFSNTTPQTHRMTARLLEVGIDPAAIYQEIYENTTKEGIILLREALNTLEFYAGDKVAYITITRETMDKTGAREEDTEGIINYTRSIQGVEIGILFREMEQDKTRVGFRSRQVDIARLAVIYGGGGHPLAAGCQLSKPLPEARDEILGRVGRLLLRGAKNKP